MHVKYCLTKLQNFKKKLTLPSGLWVKANEPEVDMLYWTSSSSSLDKTGSVTIEKLLFKAGLKGAT